jgi:hypothetical protein
MSCFLTPVCTLRIPHWQAIIIAAHMVRYDVNKRKHPVYGALARDRTSGSDGCDVNPGHWSDAPQDCQMHLACKTFDMVRRAYDELRNWQPNVQA